MLLVNTLYNSRSSNVLLTKPSTLTSLYADYIALYLWNHLEKVNQPIQQLRKSEKCMVVVEFKLMRRWNM